MHEFEYYTPTKVIFGEGSLEKLPQAVKGCGASRVFVVYGGMSADELRELLDEGYEKFCE